MKGKFRKTNMKIVPLGFDSFGVRSMCTFVETKDVKIIIDPGVSLAPIRFGLPPHPLELERENLVWEVIKKHTLEADIAIITHYHYDHHNPAEPEIFKDKILLIKHPRENINRSQMRRSAYFLDRLSDIPEKIDFADGKEYDFGNTSILISDAVCHGTNSRLGYVIEVCIDDGSSRFLFSSDVEGPSLEEQIEFMLKCDADIVFVDGPMTYMLGFRYPGKALKKSIDNLKKLIEKTGVEKLVLDHHLTRDGDWKSKLDEVIKCGEELGVHVLSAAKFMGLEEELLEASRKELYKNFPVNK